MKKKKYLPLYERWMETGKIPHCGLCNCFKRDLFIKLFSPDDNERTFLFNKGISITYWGSGLGYNDGRNPSMFTPLRQTIVLLMAAMNDEL